MQHFTKPIQSKLAINKHQGNHLLARGSHIHPSKWTLQVGFAFLGDPTALVLNFLIQKKPSLSKYNKISHPSIGFWELKKIMWRWFFLWGGGMWFFWCSRGRPLTTPTGWRFVWQGSRGRKLAGKHRSAVSNVRSDGAMDLGFTQAAAESMFSVGYFGPKDGKFLEVDEWISCWGMKYLNFSGEKWVDVSGLIFQGLCYTSGVDDLCCVYFLSIWLDEKIEVLRGTRSLPWTLDLEIPSNVTKACRLLYSQNLLSCEDLGPFWWNALKQDYTICLLNHGRI